MVLMMMSTVAFGGFSWILGSNGRGFHTFDLRISAYFCFYGIFYKLESNFCSVVVVT